jgi:hypothetical protein
MTDPEPTTIAQLASSIETAWDALHALLSAVEPSAPLRKDPAGWTVTDHVTHLAVWVDSVAILFRGGLRHDALGMTEAEYSASSFDEINEVIRRRFSEVTLPQAVAQLEKIHKEFVGRVTALADADLGREVRTFFRTAPGSDDRRLVTLLWDNSGDHYLEHLEWMRALVVAAD